MAYDTQRIRSLKEDGFPAGFTHSTYLTAADLGSIGADGVSINLAPLIPGDVVSKAAVFVDESFNDDEIQGYFMASVGTIQDPSRFVPGDRLSQDFASGNGSQPATAQAIGIGTHLTLRIIFLGDGQLAPAYGRLRLLWQVANIRALSDSLSAGIANMVEGAAHAASAAQDALARVEVIAAGIGSPQPQGGLQLDGAGYGAIVGHDIPFAGRVVTVAGWGQRDSASNGVLWSNGSASNGGWRVWLGYGGFRLQMMQPNVQTSYVDHTWTLDNTARHHYALVMDAREAAPVLKLYVDGVLASTVTPEPTGTFADPAVPALGIGGYRNAASATPWQNMAPCTLGALQVYNCELTAAETAELAKTGGQIVPLALRGGRTMPTYVSDFTASLSGWGAVGQMDYGQTIAGETGCLRFEKTAESIQQSARNMASDAYAMDRGQLRKYRCTVKVYIPSSNSYVSQLRIINSVGTERVRADAAVHGFDRWFETHLEYSISQTATGAIYEYMRPTNAAGQVAGGLGDVIYIKDIKYECIGAVLDLPLDDGAGYHARDRAPGRRRALLSASGCTHLLPGDRYFFEWTRSATSGTATGYLGDLARPVIDGPMTSVWATVDGATTISLGHGTVANAASHVASVNLPAAGKYRLVLLADSPGVSSQALHLTSDTVGVSVTISVEGVKQ